MAAVTAATQLEGLLSLHAVKTGRAPHMSIDVSTVGSRTGVRLRIPA